MLCKKPLFIKGMYYPCGQCMPCRIKRKREWTHRIMLESGLQSDNTFFTLTYSEENLPIGSSLVYGPTMPSHPTLLKSDVQKWLKRFRKAISPLKIRLVYVGEYGDMTQRPHYHGAIFGYPNCLRGKTRYMVGVNRTQKRCCPHCDLIMDTWGRGHIMLGSLTAESAQYIAGYVTKKMTAKDDPRLMGRAPEFFQPSLNGAIGSKAMWDVASTMLEFNLDQTEADVPVSLRHGSRELPLGRTLRKKLRSYIGRSENAPQEAIDQYQEKMRPLFETVRNNKENPSVTDHLKVVNEQKIRNMEYRLKLFGKKKGL